MMIRDKSVIQDETEQKRNPVLSEKQGIYPRLFQVHGLGHAWIK